jgi:hypothetical protein
MSRFHSHTEAMGQLKYYMLSIKTIFGLNQFQNIIQISEKQK